MPFLVRQLELIRPELVITLGEQAFQAMGFEGVRYRDALCQLLLTEEWMLFAPVGFHFKTLAWPHPSGLNRWLNSPPNLERLRASFAYLRPYLEH